MNGLVAIMSSLSKEELIGILPYKTETLKSNQIPLHSRIQQVKSRKHPLRRWACLQMVVRKQVTSHHWRSHYVQKWLPSAVTQKHPMAKQGDGHLDLERAFGQSVIQPSNFRVWHLHIFCNCLHSLPSSLSNFPIFSLKKNYCRKVSRRKPFWIEHWLYSSSFENLGNAEVRGLCIALTLLLTDRDMYVYIHTYRYMQKSSQYYYSCKGVPVKPGNV